MKKKVVEAAKAENAERFKATQEQGLTEEQVRQRISEGLVNDDQALPTKSIKRIFYDNIVTLFNVLNLLLGIAVFCVGSYKNMLFLGVMFFNTVIGIVQEIRAKRTIDKLSIVSATKVTVVRDGAKQKLRSMTSYSMTSSSFLRAIRSPLTASLFQATVTLTNLC